MRIGIITQPLHFNYGGILQNYALQQVLKRMGHEAWTIDYRRFDWLDWADNAWRVVAHKMLGHNLHFAKTPGEVRKSELPLRRFVNKHITLTEPRTKRFERQTIKQYAFDTIIVGSDQVWRPQYNYDVRDCFLRFAKGMKLKRIAYAASFGTDAWEFTDKQTQECTALANDFDAISVREKSGIAMCKQYLNVDAEHVLDPTLLLSVDDYRELCKDIISRPPFVFAYILDESEEKLNQIRSFAQRHGMGYLIKSADTTVTMADSLELWLSCFRDAAYVITDSFHGTVFSIIFNKDFYVFGNIARGNSRFDSLLETFDLKSRMIASSIPESFTSIDWNHVNKVRSQLRQESLKWLNSNL